MKKVGTVLFEDLTLDIYNSLSEPYFIAVDIAKTMGYSPGKTGQMLELIEQDEYLTTTLHRSGQGREVYMVTELGLYNILSQSRKPAARLWRRVVHQQLIDLRNGNGLTILDQFEEWEDATDGLYIDEKTGVLMQSVTVAGGDVIQVVWNEE